MTPLSAFDVTLVRVWRLLGTGFTVYRVVALGRDIEQFKRRVKFTEVVMLLLEEDGVSCVISEIKFYFYSEFIRAMLVFNDNSGVLGFWGHWQTSSQQRPSKSQDTELVGEPRQTTGQQAT